MSKNLTRKGLAFGALVALGASVFAGAPAYAADTVVLAANYTADKTLAAPVTESLTLNASLAPGSTAGNIAQLKYKIVTDSSFVAKAVATSGGDSTPTNNYTRGTASTSPSTTTGVAVANLFTASHANNNVLTTTYVTPRTTPTAVAINTLDLSINAINASTLATPGTAGTGAAPETSTATKTVVVTAFIDANLNGILDSGEVAQEQTVKFLKFSDITTDTVITAPTQGDTSITAVVKFTNVNQEALTNTEIGAYFTKGDGTDFGRTFDVTDRAADGASPAVVTISAANDLVAGESVVVALTTNIAALTGTKTVATATSSAITYGAANGTTQAALSTSTVIGSVTRGATALGNVLLNGNVTSNYRAQTAVVYSSTAGGFKFVTGLVNPLAKASAVKVQPLLVSTGTTAATDKIGTAQTASVTNRSVSSLAASFVKSTTALTAAATSNVALNTTKSASFLVKDTAATPAAFAGQVVSVTVTSSTALSATKTITINGTTYTSSASLPGATGVAKLTATTGSDGKAVFTYTTAGFASGDNEVVTLKGTIENFSADAVGNETARTYSSYIENNEGNTAVTTDGVAVPVTVVVLDQFGGTPANGTFQISATETSNTQATTAATTGTGSDTVANVVDGKATLSLVDNGTGLGNAVFALVRYSVAANGVVNTPIGVIQNIAIATAPAFGTAGTVTGPTALTQFTVAVKAAADIAAGEVKLTANDFTTVLGKNTAETASVLGAVVGGGTTGTLTYSAFASVDGRKIAVAAPSIKNNAGTVLDDAGHTLGDAAFATVYGVVNSKSTATYGGVNVPSASVTVTGAGQLFRASQDGADVWGDGTLTFNANASGQFTLYVYSHKAGTQTITVTSGTGSSKLEVKFTAAAAADAKTVDVAVADAAAQFQAGRALDVVVSVADAFGNPITTTAYVNAATVGNLSITQTGAGYLATSGNVTTNAAGKFTTKLITNAGDLGTSSIVALLNQDNTDDTLDISKTVASEFGVTDADVTVGGRAVYASVEFAKGKTVTVSVDGKRLYSKLQSTDAYTELKFTQKKAGKHTVTVRISGGIVYSEVVNTTK